MGFQKFGTGEVIGQDGGDAQGIQVTGAEDRAWTPQDAAELEHESTVGITEEE